MSGFTCGFFTSGFITGVDFIGLSAGFISAVDSIGLSFVTSTFSAGAAFVVIFIISAMSVTFLGFLLAITVGFTSASSANKKEGSVFYVQINKKNY